MILDTDRRAPAETFRNRRAGVISAISTPRSRNVASSSGREVRVRGRRGHRSAIARKHRLIAFAIGRVRQRA